MATGVQTHLRNGQEENHKRWSGRPGSNRRHPAWEAGVLPLNYSRSGYKNIRRTLLDYHCRTSLTTAQEYSNVWRSSRMGKKIFTAKVAKDSLSSRREASDRSVQAR